MENCGVNRMGRVLGRIELYLFLNFLENLTEKKTMKSRSHAKEPINDAAAITVYRTWFDRQELVSWWFLIKSIRLLFNKQKKTRKTCNVQHETCTALNRLVWKTIKEKKRAKQKKTENILNLRHVFFCLGVLFQVES